MDGLENGRAALSREWLIRRIVICMQKVYENSCMMDAFRQLK